MSSTCTPFLCTLDRTDAPAMAELERACFTLPWTYEQCLGALHQASFSARGIFVVSELIGYISCYHAADQMEIVNLAVAEKWRRHGYARILLQSLLQDGLKMGMEKVFLEVRCSNAPAIALYQGEGFVQVGCRPRYYYDTGEDGLVMSRELNVPINIK